jgi:anti-sigma B factor antagonist
MLSIGLSRNERRILMLECKTTHATPVIFFPEKIVINSENALDFKQSLKHYLTQVNYRIVIDANNLEFIDSSGISAMISCLKIVSPHDGFIHFACIPAPIREVFHLIRLDRLFSFFDTVDQAVVHNN